MFTIFTEIDKQIKLKMLDNSNSANPQVAWANLGQRPFISILSLNRNKITTLIRLSKKQYFHNYFQWNIFSMKKTWAGISELINRGRKKKEKNPCLKG